MLAAAAAKRKATDAAVPVQEHTSTPPTSVAQSRKRVKQQLSAGAPLTAGQPSPVAEDGSAPHLPVLLQQVLDSFAPVNLKVYVDGTLGAGGHALALLQAHPEMSVLAGIDVDPTAHRIARARLEGHSRVDASAATSALQLHFLQGNYCDVQSLIRSVTGQPLAGRVDGMLLDLGVSSMQFDTADRGFSFMQDGPLDMRMDPGAVLSAEEVINTWSEADLGRIIRDYGEEKLWRVVARRIAQHREAAPIRSTRQLVSAIGQTTLGGGGAAGGSGRRAGGKKGIHPATRTFQALRIAVNDELNRLQQALPAALSLLSPGGRLAVISFHSLEDRIVKHLFMTACGQATPDQEHLTRGPDSDQFLYDLQRTACAKKVTRKPLTANEDELAANPRARSAKLRVVQKL